MQGQVFGVEMPFIIQAKDTCNNKRSSGGDLFTVSLILGVLSQQASVELPARFVMLQYTSSVLCQQHSHTGLTNSM